MNRSKQTGKKCSLYSIGTISITFHNTLCKYNKVQITFKLCASYEPAIYFRH